MDGRTDPLNDAALEHEIEALLSAEPSADFVARVRSRVAEEPRSTGWGWRWPLAAIATGVAAVAIGVVLWQPADTTTRSTSAALPRVAVADSPRPAIAPPPEAPAAVPLRHAIRNGVIAPLRAVEIALPEVIVAENETTAFAALVADRRETRYEVSLSTRSVDEPIEINVTKIDPVSLEPIKIKPLVDVTELE